MIPRNDIARRYSQVGLTAAWLLTLPAVPTLAEPLPINPAKLSRIATVDARFQSYNIEMIEVTRGGLRPAYEAMSTVAPAGAKPDLFAARAPIDLGNARLR